MMAPPMLLVLEVVRLTPVEVDLWLFVQLVLVSELWVDLVELMLVETVAVEE